MAMKRVYYFCGDDLYGKIGGRIHFLKKEVMDWLIENINHHLLIDDTYNGLYVVYGVKLFSAADAMAFKLRWL